MSSGSKICQRCGGPCHGNYCQPCYYIVNRVKEKTCQVCEKVYPVNQIRDKRKNYENAGFCSRECCLKVVITTDKFRQCFSCKKKINIKGHTYNFAFGGRYYCDACKEQPKPNRYQSYTDEKVKPETLNKLMSVILEGDELWREKRGYFI